MPKNHGRTTHARIVVSIVKTRTHQKTKHAQAPTEKTERNTHTHTHSNKALFWWLVAFILLFVHSYLQLASFQIPTYYRHNYHQHFFSSPRRACIFKAEQILIETTTNGRGVERDGLLKMRPSLRRKRRIVVEHIEWCQYYHARLSEICMVVDDAIVFLPKILAKIFQHLIMHYWIIIMNFYLWWSQETLYESFTLT